jgi:hypothetical protein
MTNAYAMHDIHFSVCLPKMLQLQLVQQHQYTESSAPLSEDLTYLCAGCTLHLHA